MPVTIALPGSHARARIISMADARNAGIVMPVASGSGRPAGRATSSRPAGRATSRASGSTTCEIQSIMTISVSNTGSHARARVVTMSYAWNARVVMSNSIRSGKSARSSSGRSTRCPRATTCSAADQIEAIMTISVTDTRSHARTRVVTMP
ncbi:MAG: hypothetical protein K2W95_10815 [Candidatus Obscuribacterales bacterium]|nr:hypothetical protein [Candidatus Obscuribacterales bacterium]